MMHPTNHGRRSSAWVGLRPSPGVVGVLVALTLAFAAYVLLGHPAFVIDHLALHPRRALGPEPWQLVTSAFVHDRFGALLSSGIAIWLFGTPVEQRAGRGHLFTVLVGATLLGSLATAALGRFIAPHAVLSGAEPAAMACIAAFGVVYGRTPLMLFGVQQMKATTCAFIFLGISAIMYVWNRDLLGFVGAGTGAAFGAWGASYVGLGRLQLAWNRLRLWRLRRRYRVIPGGRDSKRYLN